METFFDHLWKNDHNQAITEEKDLNIYEQLPNDV
jgi:hypothetical protein